MLRTIFIRHCYVFAWVMLGAIALLTLVACLVFGLRNGLIAGVVLFVVLDGIGSVWEVATYASRQLIGEDVSRQEHESLSRGSKDNPTIR